MTVDTLVGSALLPGAHKAFNDWNFPMGLWLPICLCLFMGFVRVLSPYAISFQGSRLGRVLTRQFFLNVHNRWLPVQRVQDFNTECDKNREEDSSLAKLAIKAAEAIERARESGCDDRMAGQVKTLSEEGFRLVGFGSGGYSLYVTHEASSSGSSDGNNRAVCFI